LLKVSISRQNMQK